MAKIIVTNKIFSDIEDRNLVALLDVIIKIRDEARKNKDYKTSDIIRDKLTKIGYNIKDND